MDALVVTLREGIEAALVIGIILSYLTKSGRPHLKRSVLLGTITAAAASIGLAIVLNALGIGAENDLVEGILYLVAATAVTSMVVWMWSASRKMRTHVEGGVERAVAKRSAAVGLFAFTFFMIAREGVEAVLFVMALAREGGSGFVTVVGAISGLALALGFGVLFVRGTLSIDLNTFFKATSAVLLVLAVKFFASSVHGFAEVGRITLNESTMRVIGYVVRDKSSTWLLVGLILFPMLTTVVSLLRRPVARLDSGSAAEQRKAVAATQSERRWTFGAVGFTVAVVGLLSYAALTAAPLYEPAPQSVTAKDGRVELDLSATKDNTLYKYAFGAKGKEVRFVVYDRGSQFGVGLDACDVCGAKGYAQEGNVLICLNCNAPIPVASIGQPGGCNPIALKATTEGSRLIIAEADLDAASAALSKTDNSMEQKVANR